MFHVADTPVMVVGLLVLFTFCAVWEVVALARSRTATQRVSSGLHLVMALVMAGMVLPLTWAPLRDVVGFPVLIGFFALGVAWFVALALRGADHRWHFAGHAVMFAAMAWHLAGMAVMRQAMQGGSAPGHGHAAHTGHAGGAMASQPLGVVAWVGVPFMAYLAVGALVALVRALAPVRRAPHSAAVADEPGVGALVPVGCTAPHRAGGLTQRMSELAAAAMLGGMFWMSVGLLAPVAPWLGVLSF
ncbi:DUF5134 domain-containing protein [Propioniciclava soli]|uniref:DUF5134 domain-containing protein n=1 Tax=Propioniciclava soli TaxID=2775081 RepID=A0ABZ3CBF4_9ACTN|nr:DUF5134 domain-containing protein [Propioniciclava soli]